MGASGKSSGKADGAFRTIGELSDELGIAPHILRYWEGKFPALQPLKRAGGRRYYRVDDVALVKAIHQALEVDGYTIKGAQKLFAPAKAKAVAQTMVAGRPADAPLGDDQGQTSLSSVISAPAVSAVDITRLVAVRNRLAQLL